MMRVTIFSSNQPRHLNLVRKFSRISDQVFFVSEVNTVFPGQVADFFKNSEVMQSYFQNVIASEIKIFGSIGFLPSNVSVLSIKSGDLNKLDKSQLEEALSSDIYIVFGASYIRGWLINYLIEHKAVNIHMGISPYYRGSSCNFWALYDNNPNHVGATIHLLSDGLDSGDILFHCAPKVRPDDSPFDFSMRSVLVAQQGLASAVVNKMIFNLQPTKQDKNKEVRYTKSQDFTDEVAKEFLQRNVSLTSSFLPDPKLLKPLII